MADVIITTTGTVSPVKLEELGAYFDHPTSAYTLSDSFTIAEIANTPTLQAAMDNGEVTVVDENNNVITNLSYLVNPIPVFAIDNVTFNKSYVGFGASGSCKILEVITATDGLNTSLWSSGSESFDKIWSARTSYSYF